MKKLVLFLVLFFTIERFCYWQTGGFALSKMMRGCISSAYPTEQLTYLASGKQFYAFETQGGSTVVKFMKLSRRKPVPWLEKLLLPYPLSLLRNHYLSQRKKRLTELELSIDLACLLLREETGLIPYSQKNVTLTDKLGIQHSIDLSKTRFIAQRKASLFPTYFLQNPHEAHALIDSYLQTVFSQCKKGITNLDPLIERNFGVVQGKVILLDIGSLIATKKPLLKRQLFFEVLPLREWLKKYSPENVPYFDDRLKLFYKLI